MRVWKFTCIVPGSDCHIATEERTKSFAVNVFTLLNIKSL